MRRTENWVGISLGMIVTPLVILLLATSVAAGVGGGAVMTWPTSAVVGELFTASVLIYNASTAPNDTEHVRLLTLFVTPACASGLTFVCLATPVDYRDPGVFKILSAVGDASTVLCAGVTFNVGDPNKFTGEVALDPFPATVTLRPAIENLANRSCQVNITFRVYKVPTNPAPGPPVTTHPLTRATLHGVSSPLFGTAANTDEITITKATPTLASISNPNTNVMPGGIVVDTATVTKAPGAIAPTGSVRFILCQPDEVTANGCPAGSGTKVGPDRSLVNGSANTLLHLDGATPGKHCWRARYLGDANYKPRNHTNATTECFTVQ